MVPRGARVKLVDGLAAPVSLDLDTHTAPGRGFAPCALFSSGVVPRRGMNNWSVIHGPYGQPRGLAVDGAGNLYVADPDNNRVLKYSPGP